MTIEVLDNPSGMVRGESFACMVDYDTVAQTVGLTVDPTSTAHGTLTLVDVASQVPIASVSCDPYVDGLRHIVAGPGAVGTNLLDGQPLPTKKVPASWVAQLGSKGVPPSYEIDCSIVP